MHPAAKIRPHTVFPLRLARASCALLLVLSVVFGAAVAGVRVDAAYTNNPALYTLPWLR